jgi:hypothetical protein
VGKWWIGHKSATVGSDGKSIVGDGSATAEEEVGGHTKVWCSHPAGLRSENRRP